MDAICFMRFHLSGFYIRIREVRVSVNGTYGDDKKFLLELFDLHINTVLLLPDFIFSFYGPLIPTIYSVTLKLITTSDSISLRA